MWKLIRKFRSFPEEKKIIAYGKMAFIKSLFYFLFKITVGLYYKSWFIIAIAIYSLFIGYVKNNCSSGLWRNKESIKDIHAYIRGGSVLAGSSVFYIIYSFFSIYYPSNFKYNMVIAIAIAAFATYCIVMSIIGVAKTPGKTMLIKEYKFTNFATGLNNLVLAQIALLAFTNVQNYALYNGIIGITVGFVIFAIGVYLVVDGLIKKHRYYKIINDYPEIKKYIDN